MGIEFETTQTVTPPMAGAGGGDRRPQRLRTPLTAAEFGLVRWIARRSGGGKFRRPPSLDEFVRLALFNAVRARLTLIAGGGGNIPPGVAKDYDEWSRKMTTSSRDLAR